MKNIYKSKRSLNFLKELKEQLDLMPDKKLIAGVHETSRGQCCAIGVVLKGRNKRVDQIPEKINKKDSKADAYYRYFAEVLNISQKLTHLIVFVNDNCVPKDFPPELRWNYVRKWVQKKIEEQNV